MLLLKNGHVIAGAGAPEQLRADVLIDAGVIRAIGADLTSPEAEVIDVSGHIVMPGLIDTHRHVWQAPLRGVGANMDMPGYFSVVLGRALSGYRPDDAHFATMLGAAEALDAGVTTLFDWSNVTRTSADLDAVASAYHDMGARAVVAQENPVVIDSDLVTSARAILGPEYGDWDTSVRQIAEARELGLVTTMHAGGRLTRRLHDAGLLGPDLLWVHMNAVTGDDVKMLVDADSGISVTPLVEAIMGHGSSPFGRFREAGGRPALGVDVVINAPGDLFEPMRDTLRTFTFASAGSLLDAVTIDAARAIGLQDRIGSLAVGKQADIIVLSGLSHLAGVSECASAVVTCLGRADVDMVLVNGEVVKRDGRLVHADLRSLRETGSGIAKRVLG